MRIHNVTYNDLSNIKKLQPEGWSDITIDFVKYLNYSFCEPIKLVVDDVIVGIGCSILFKNSAWIAHIIVHPEYRNKGFAFYIVNYLIQYLSSKKFTSISLIATSLGEPVYKKAGFRFVSNYAYLLRESAWINKDISNNFVLYSPNYYKQLIELDKEITGECRENILQHNLNHCLLYVENSILKGYYMPFLGEGAIYAHNDSVGLELMKLKYSIVDKAVVPSENKVAIDFLKKNGFVENDTTGIRMIFGDDIDWKPTCFFSRIGGNFG